MFDARTITDHLAELARLATAFGEAYEVLVVHNPASAGRLRRATEALTDESTGARRQADALPDAHLE